MAAAGFDVIHAAYMAARAAPTPGWTRPNCSRAVRDLVHHSLAFLLSDACEEIALISRVPGKAYLAYVRADAPAVTSRPANRALFLPDLAEVESGWDDWLAGRPIAVDAGRFWYTVAIAPCMALELFDRQNKKGPATYFEVLIGHIVAKQLAAEPRRAATLTIEGRPTRLTMDFLFDETPRTAALHLPVKMSTRERVVQAWAHQRILDAAYGVGTYKGVMVCFSETKLDSRSLEVVEICVPDQWLAYQALLARMTRIYYFDIPVRYRALTATHPHLIEIGNVHDLPREIEGLVAR